MLGLTVHFYLNDKDCHRFWHNNTSSVVARCTLMGPPKNGFYIKGRNKGDVIKHGERINYDCIGSYSLVGNSTQGCSDGQWSNPSPTCKGIYNKVNLLFYLISELNQESLIFSFFWGGGLKKKRRGVLRS